MQNVQPIHCFNNIPTQQIIKTAVDILNAKNITGHTFEINSGANTIYDKTQTYRPIKISKVNGENNCCVMVTDCCTANKFIVHGFQQLTDLIESIGDIEKNMDIREITNRAADILRRKNIPNHLFTISPAGELWDSDMTASVGRTNCYRLFKEGNIIRMKDVNNDTISDVQSLSDITNKVISKM